LNLLAIEVDLFAIELDAGRGKSGGGGTYGFRCCWLILKLIDCYSLEHSDFFS
jgi:hypothetical protein